MKTDVIILARHGEPDLSRNVRLNWRGYKYWWRLYDEAGLKPSERAPQIIKDVAKQADIIIASTLPRAIETAEAACEGKVDHLEPLLVEAPLPPPNLGYFRFGPRTWSVFARTAWLPWFFRRRRVAKAGPCQSRKSISCLVRTRQRRQDDICGRPWLV